jgi:hypothetical protein
MSRCRRDVPPVKEDLMATRFSVRILSVVALFLTLQPALRAADAAPDVPALIRQLGDPDFRKREAATARLKELGKAAAPALREALGGGDPEVCARAESLLRQLERPRIPAGWFGQFNFGLRRESNFAGSRTIEVEQPGRRLTIREGPGGIELNVRGNDDGHDVNVTVRARDLDELRRQDPDAYELYERVAGARSNLNLRGRRLVVPAVPGPQRPLPVPVPVQPPRAGARLLPLAPPEGIARPPADDLMQLEARLRRQMQAAGVAPAEQEAVLQALQMLREIQDRGRLATPEDLEAQVKKYNALSDALRQKLEELKLPGPGDALPPPARARRGVSVAPPGAPGAADEGVLVRMVMPQSRGEKVGLLGGDVIRKVNGKPVTDAAALRRELTELKEPLVLDVKRGGEDLVLREKAAK